MMKFAQHQREIMEGTDGIAEKSYDEAKKKERTVIDFDSIMKNA